MEREDDLVELTTRPNELDAGLVCEVLRSGGIEATMRAASGIALGVFGASSFNPVSVLVRRDMVDEANRLLSENKQASVDIDWEEVDVGEPADDIARKIAQKDPLDLAGPRQDPVVKLGHAVPMVLAAVALLVIGSRFGSVGMIVALGVSVSAGAVFMLMRRT